MMTKSEYELLQAKFRQKLNSRVYLSGKQAGAYKDGVKACMSILSSHCHHEEDMKKGERNERN